MNGTKETTLAELIASKFLKCSKCQQIYKEPQILPCLHSFCTKCIAKITEEVPVAENQELLVRLQCPLCKSFIGVPEGGTGTFPENTFLANLIYVQNYKENTTRECDYCKYDGKDHKATNLCLDCKDDMCDNCTEAHHRTKITRSHQVIPFQQIQNGLYDHDIRSKQYPTCSKHEENMENFCEVCEILICSKCKVSDHDSHNSITFDTALPQYKRHINGLTISIQSQIPKLSNYIKYLNKYGKSINESKQKMETEIENQAAALHRLIDSYKEELMTKLNESCEKETKEVCQKQQNLEIAEKSLQDNATYLDFLLKHGRSDEILALHKQITFRLTQLANMEIDGMNKQLKLNFSVGSNVEQNLKILFGKLTLDHAPVSEKNGGPQKENGLISISTVLPPLKQSPLVVTTFDLEGSGDSKDVWPTGVAITQTDDVVIVDRDNQNVKVFDKAGKLTLEFVGKPDNKLGSPFDVAVLKNGNMAVTDYETNEVKIFDSKGQYLSSIIGHFKHPRGITTNSKGEIIVVDCGTLQLTVHDYKTGELIRTIKGTDKSGARVLVDPYCVAVMNNDNILVTDTAAPNIKIFSSAGKYLASYGTYGTKQDQILKPFGICCDDFGYIFVSDNENHRIHVLLPDGTFSKYLLTKNEGLWHPMGLAITKNGHFLVTEALGKARVYRYI